MTTKIMLKIMVIGLKNKTPSYTIFMRRHTKDTAPDLN